MTQYDAILDPFMMTRYDETYKANTKLGHKSIMMSHQ